MNFARATRSQLGSWADDLRALADRIQQPDMPHIQQAMVTASEAGFPSKSSGVPGESSNQFDEHGAVAPSTATERGALNVDQTAVAASDRLQGLTATLAGACELSRVLDAYAPDPKARGAIGSPCPVCSMVIPEGRQRCQELDANDIQCMGRIGQKAAPEKKKRKARPPKWFRAADLEYKKAEAG